MKLERIIYIPEAEISITREEINLLLKWSSEHYDYKCKEAGAVGGFLYGFSNHFIRKNKTTRVRVTMGELDLLMKICETVHPRDAACSLLKTMEIHSIFRKLKDEYESANTAV
jgi:hypothetical protein